jgi:hypothetical protein
MKVTPESVKETLEKIAADAAKRREERRKGMKTDHVIIVHETVLHSWLNDGFTFLMLMVFMGTGAYMESFLMQLVGAGMFFMTMMGWSQMKENRFDIPGARKKLDELEAELGLKKEETE